MKNPLTIITKQPLVNKTFNTVSTFVKGHESALLTGGSVAFNLSGILTTYKNSPKIHEVITITRERLNGETDTEERKRITRDGLKELVPLVTPIVTFFILSTTCSIVNHKRQEAKITALTTALGVAKSTINEYETFKKEVRKELGEEKYKELKTEVNAQELDKQIQNALFVPKPNEEAVWFPYIGQFFSSTEDRINAVFERINGILDGTIAKSYGHYTVKGNEAILLSDLCEDLDVEEIPMFAYNAWYDAGKVREIGHFLGSIKLYGKSYLCLEIDPPTDIN